ncbi:hypothetical protein NUW54_g1304 [Trametes sanguinea]|uniref:Uncharacterized protein n=2 Tax=Trametes sanguinea TaxID=158606 RepID=A0ACC1Q2M2_9APHY|nr:hypothetical protein NUW54_g2989 [Trametes sanguinea]KAJ3014461.1 hypothetical protein NUW54_g1304 [Trametes sanguinea]
MDFPVREEMYYLADAGFPNCNALLVPYQGVRYHLQEWATASQKYAAANLSEALQLAHASAQSVVEHIFGVVKHRFQLMVQAAEYSLKTQAKLVHTLCTLHNFIRIHDPDDLEAIAEHDVQPSYSSSNTLPSDFSGGITAAEREEASSWWDTIAKQMWEDYVAYVERR